MELIYDHEADAIYIRLRDAPYAFGHNLDYERRIDYAADEKPMGIELLDVSHGVNVDDLPERAAITCLLEKHHIKTYA